MLKKKFYQYFSNGKNNLNSSWKIKIGYGFFLSKEKDLQAFHEIYFKKLTCGEDYVEKIEINKSIWDDKNNKQ